jgi:phosphate transport system substrate-binding protein
LYPAFAGSVVLAYRVDQLQGQPPINFTRDLIVQIFLGNVKTWNDPQIVDINPQVRRSGEGRR